MTLLIKYDKIFKKYKIWEKLTNITYKEFDSNPVYNEKYIKAKTKFYNKKTNTNFRGNQIEIPNESLECVCLSVILLDSVYRKDNKYFPQVFLEEYKYVVNEKKLHNYITDDAQISSDSDEEDLLQKTQIEKNSDYEENSNEEIMEKIKMEKNSDEENKI